MQGGRLRLQLWVGWRLLFAAVVLSMSSSARAYVRSTTGFAGNTPLAWSSGCVVMAVARPPAGQIPWEDLVGAVVAAGDTWTQAAATCGGGFRFVAERAGSSLGVENDGVNDVVLRTKGYCSRDCDPLSMAITWTYEIDAPGSREDGRIVEADIEINAEAYQWGLGADAAAGVNDLQSALVHELGHVLGLDHPCYDPGFGLPRLVDEQGNPAPNCSAAPAPIVDSIMFPQSRYLGERRALSDDDVRGICAIYPAVTSPTCQGRVAPPGGCALAGEPKPIPPLVCILLGVVFVSFRWRR